MDRDVPNWEFSSCSNVLSRYFASCYTLVNVIYCILCGCLLNELFLLAISKRITAFALLLIAGFGVAEVIEKHPDDAIKDRFRVLDNAVEVSVGKDVVKSIIIFLMTVVCSPIFPSLWLTFAVNLSMASEIFSASIGLLRVRDILLSHLAIFTLRYWALLPSLVF